MDFSNKDYSNSQEYIFYFSLNLIQFNLKSDSMCEDFFFDSHVKFVNLI